MQPYTLSFRGSDSGRRLARTLTLIISHSFCSMRDLLVSFISPFLALRHWSGECRQLARILPTPNQRLWCGAAAKAQ
jgi:hypothetical protein